MDEGSPRESTLEISMEEAPKERLQAFASGSYPDIWSHCLYHPGMLNSFTKYKLQRKRCKVNIAKYIEYSSSYKEARYPCVFSVARNSFWVKFRMSIYYPFLVSSTQRNAKSRIAIFWNGLQCIHSPYSDPKAK